MSMGQDWAQLETDAGQLAVQLDALFVAGAGVLAALEGVKTDCEAILGTDLEALFSAQTAPQAMKAVNWQNVITIVKTYGPVIYAYLAAILGWPALPPLPGV